MNLRSLLWPTLVWASVSMTSLAAELAVQRPGLSPVGLSPSPTGGARRILLVDDDVSENNYKPGDPRLSPSDRVFRQLVADAVGGDSAAWDIETVRAYANGPDVERLRPFSIVIWYTGSSYGGNPDNTSVLSIEDEKNVRRYLEEVGGTVVLISPGYLSKTLDAGSTDGKANWPFLTEVLGVRGGVGLAKRFEAGIVKTSGGAQFEVGKGSATVETQFSSIKPEAATVVFTSSLAPTKGPDATVACSNPYGRGRIVYVGFTFENLAEAALAPAFQTLLAAAAPPADPTVALVRPEILPSRQLLGASPEPLTFEASGTAAVTRVKWTLPSAPAAPTSSPFSGQTARQKMPASDPGLTVKLERWTRLPTVYGEAFDWKVMALEPGARQVVDSLAKPGTAQRYRLTLTNTAGASGFKEVAYNVPPAQDPASLSAHQESDGTVVLTWPEVPGITRYQLKSLAHNFRSPTVSTTTDIVTGATQWRSPPLDGRIRIWSITSLYQDLNGEYVSLTPAESWPSARTELNPEFILTNAMVELFTGNDNKELLSQYEIRLYINGGGANTGNNPLNLQQYGAIVGGSNEELKVHTGVLLTKDWKPGQEWLPAIGDLEYIRQYGLRLVIRYLPNFFTDAWKLEKVSLTLSFQKEAQIARKTYSEGMDMRVVLAQDVGKLLTASDNQVEFVIDPSRLPPAPRQ